MKKDVENLYLSRVLKEWRKPDEDGQTKSDAYLDDVCGEPSLRHLEPKCCPVLTGS